MAKTCLCLGELVSFFFLLFFGFDWKGTKIDSFIFVECI